MSVSFKHLVHNGATKNHEVTFELWNLYNFINFKIDFNWSYCKNPNVTSKNVWSHCVACPSAYPGTKYFQITFCTMNGSFCSKFDIWQLIAIDTKIWDKLMFKMTLSSSSQLLLGKSCHFAVFYAFWQVSDLLNQKYSLICLETQKKDKYWEI